MLVTFDFDQTLTVSRWDEENEDFVHMGPNLVMVQCLKAHLDMGNEVHIVTSRHEKFEKVGHHDAPRVSDFLRSEGIFGQISGIHFTNGEWKADTIKRLGSLRHHDDDEEELIRLHEDCECIHVPTGWLGISD